MRATGQAAQHRGSIVRIPGLAEHFVVQHHFGIGAEHDGIDGITQTGQSGTRLVARYPAHIILRQFTVHVLLRHVNIEHAEIHPELLQQLATTRRLRGEIEHSEYRISNQRQA
jgi:hypothetical protein